MCFSKQTAPPSFFGRSRPRVGFPASFKVSRIDTLLESRFLFDDVVFVICSSRGGWRRGGRSPVSPAGLSGSGEPLSLGLYGQYHPRGKLRKAGEEKTVKFVPPCDAALSLCATPPAGGAPRPLPPGPSSVGKMETSLCLSSLHTAHDTLLLICCRSVYLVTTMSNMM